MPDRISSTAEAFSRKAAVYDAFGEDHPNLDRMRTRVRDHIRGLVPPGSRLLELNAGTGADAGHLAEAGYQVLATDIAPGMLARIRARSADPEMGGRLAVRELSFTDLAGLDAGPFDLVFSNMGGLNCIPDLRPVTATLPLVLVPGGYAVFVIMPRVCPWEWTAACAATFGPPRAGCVPAGRSPAWRRSAFRPGISRPSGRRRHSEMGSYEPGSRRSPWPPHPPTGRISPAAGRA